MLLAACPGLQPLPAQLGQERPCPCWKAMATLARMGTGRCQGVRYKVAGDQLWGLDGNQGGSCQPLSPCQEYSVFICLITTLVHWKRLRTQGSLQVLGHVQRFPHALWEPSSFPSMHSTRNAHRGKSSQVWISSPVSKSCRFRHCTTQAVVSVGGGNFGNEVCY